MGLFSLFGSDSRTTSNTTNTSNSNNVTTTRDIGFTGQNAVDFAASLNVPLSELISQTGGVQDRAYQFSTIALQNAGEVFDRGTARAYEGLANVVNAARDFSQRAIAAGTNQPTPITNLPAASADVAPVGEKEGDNTWIILGTVVAILALWK